MMKKTTILLVAVVVLLKCSVAYAFYSIADSGTWPEHWPAELEKLRKQSRTAVGPMIAQEHYDIPFTDRENFESAWSYILKVKSDGAPIILVRGPDTRLGNTLNAGVRIHSPPADTDKRANPEQPLRGQRSVRSRWMWTTYIELIVDGDVVDLNRIPLPADTPLADERFEGADSGAKTN